MTYIGRIKKNKIILICLMLTSLYFLPILLSHHYYVDDLGRSIKGYSNWSQNGRPIADLIFYIINFGLPLSDISPLPQALAIVTLSYTAYIIANKFTSSDEDNYLTRSMISSSFIISPFFLENISYKYDSLPMSISMLCAVMPFTVNWRSWKSMALLCMISVIFTLCIYQASINIYMILSIICALYNFKNGHDKKAFQIILISSSSLLISYVIYSNVIAQRYISGSYNIRHSELVISNIHLMKNIILNNINMFFKIISSAFTASFIYLMSCLLILSSFGFIKLYLASGSATKITFILRRTFILISPILVLFFIVGPMLLLKDPVLSPRVLMSFGMVIVFFSLVASWFLSSQSTILALIMSILFLYAVGLSYSYANSLNNQEKYENAIITLIISDVNNNKLASEDKLAFLGKMPISPEGRLAIKKYPVIQYLIQPTINNQWIWGHEQMQHFDIKQEFQSYEYHQSLKKNVCDYRLISKSNNYDMYMDDIHHTIVINFSKEICGR